MTFATIVLDNGTELLVLGPLTPGSAEPIESRFQSAGVSRLHVFERVADSCLDLPVSMIEAGQLYEELFGHVPLGTTTSAWFQYLLHPRYRAGSPLSKRVLDLGLGSIAGLLSLPILAVSAIAVKLTEPRAAAAPADPHGGGRPRDRAGQAADDAPRRRGARAPSGPATTTTASPRSAACCAACTSTSCRRSGPC